MCTGCASLKLFHNHQMFLNWQTEYLRQNRRHYMTMDRACKSGINCTPAMLDMFQAHGTQKHKLFEMFVDNDSVCEKVSIEVMKA